MKVIERLLELQVLEMGPKAGAPETAPLITNLRQEIPEQVLGHYDRLRARGKKGVALVRNQVCTGCMMRLASGAYNTLLHDADISLCDSCGRYLLMAKEAPPPPATPAPTGADAPKKRGRKKKTTPQP